MRNALYWQKRFDALQASLLNKGIEYYNNLSEQYDKAALNVQREIEAFYQRFADNNQMDLLEARKLLNTRQLKEFRWSVDEYIKKGETLNYSDQWAEELENASTRYRISRLQALQLQMQQQVEELMGNEVDGLDNVISDIYQDGYYRSIFEVQKGVGVGESFAILDKNKISKVISKPWATDGTNFSERVWGEHRASLVQSLNSDFVQTVIRGDSPDKLVKKIADDFGVAKYKAKRLVLTESAFFSSESRKDAFKELDVGWFKISATLDKSTCEDCGWREDNDPIPIGMYQVGYTSPPFHPNCRCTAIPLEDFDDGIESYRAARDKNGKYYEVSDSMTYKQWKEKYIDNKDNILKKDVKSDTINKKEDSQGAELKEICEKNEVEYISPQEFKIQPTTNEIIERLSGGDKTKGSCSSLAFAYVGNKSGLDVLDFRDGNSRRVFSQNTYIAKIAKLSGVESYIVRNINDFKAVSELLEKTVEGKEYYLATGNHAAIIRQNKLKYEFLELQSYNTKENVFKELDNKSLRKRFKCRRSRSLFGEKVESQSILIEVDSLGKNEDFRDLLGYINTMEDKQMKGVDGYAK